MLVSFYNENKEAKLNKFWNNEKEKIHTHTEEQLNKINTLFFWLVFAEGHLINWYIFYIIKLHILFHCLNMEIIKWASAILLKYIHICIWVFTVHPVCSRIKETKEKTETFHLIHSFSSNVFNLKLLVENAYRAKAKIPTKGMIHCSFWWYAARIGWCV